MVELLTPTKLEELLMNVKPGCTMLSFWSMTEPAQLKRDNPYWPIKKVSHVNAMVQFDYDMNVRTAILRNGGNPDEWETESSWHEPVLNDGKWTPLCRHKKTGELYLRARILKSLMKPRYFTANGTPLTFEEVEPWLKENKGSAKQEAAGLDEEDQIVFRVYKLSSIKDCSLQNPK